MAAAMRGAALLPGLALVASVGLGAGLSAAGCIIDWADDCGHNRGAPNCKGGVGSATASSGGGHGGTGGTSTSSMSTGGMTGCMESSTCPEVPPGPCAALGMKTCKNHVCGVEYVAGDAPSQVYGDCLKNVCDAKGTMTTENDDSDIFNSGNPCLPYACANGTLSPKMSIGAQCMTASIMMGSCEPDGHSGVLTCAECDPSSPTACNSIPGTKCATDGHCRLLHCSNKVKDSGESDVDCGGTDCVPCAIGSVCSTYKDCASSVCTNNKCAVPNCTDNTQNSDETDKDCGGKLCPKCADDLGCLAPSDCISGVCMGPGGGTPDTCQKPTCTDGVKNGGETGIDCGGDPDGGHVCPPCP